MQRTLAKNPDDRFPTMTAFADAIDRALAPAPAPDLPDAEALQLYMKAQQAVWSWSADQLMEALTELERVLAGRGDHIQLLRGVAYLRWQMVNAGISTDPVHLQKMDDYVRRMEALEPVRRGPPP